MKRQEFIKHISLATFLLADGSIFPAFGGVLAKKSRLRFLRQHEPRSEIQTHATDNLRA